MSARRRALPLTAAVASAAHLASIALVAPGVPPPYELASTLGLLAALAALAALSAVAAPPSDATLSAASGGSPWIGALACAGVAVAVTVVHFRGGGAYALFAATALGGALVAAAARERGAVLPAPRWGLGAIAALLAMAGLARALSDRGPAVWASALVCVLLLPGLGLSFLLLPASTGWITRLAWSTPLALGAQLPILLWLDWLGIDAPRPLLMALGPAIALAATLRLRFTAAATAAAGGGR